MIMKMLGMTAAAALMATSAFAQTPPDLHKRLTDIKQIGTPFGVTRIKNAEGDGRDLQVIHAWRANGNAWSYGVYMLTMPAKSTPEMKTDWLIVGVPGKDGLATQVAETPHTGEDDLKSVRFAHAMLDGKPVTLLVTAERNPDGAVPDPAVAKIKVLALRSIAEADLVGSTPDVFEIVFEYTTIKTYTDADDALFDELKLPAPKD